MRNRIVFNYILSELIAPFFLGLSVFIFILIMTQMLRLNELMIVHGVGIWSIVKLVFFLLTAFLAISIPIALLFSVLSLFGRLSADSEIIAFRAAGFSLVQLAVPVFVFSAVVSIFCLFLTIHVEAWGARSYKNLVWNIGKSKATIGIKQGVFNDNFFGLVLYTDKVDPKEKTLTNVFIYDERDPSAPVSVIAKRGALISSDDLEGVFLTLEDGAIHSMSQDYQSLQKINFETYTLNLALDELLKVSPKEKPKRLPYWLLKQRIQEFKRAGNTYKYNRYRVELHRKYAVACASLIFALLGVALGVSPTRSVRSGSFIYTILFVGAYWALTMVGKSIAVNGWLHPGASMWMANTFFLGIAGFLLYRGNRQ